MKFLLVLILMAGAGAYFYPPQAENTDSPCGALERRLGMLVQAELQKLPRGLPAPANDPRVVALLGRAQAVVPTGAIATAYVREKFPILPPNLGCVAGYWKTIVDPDITQYLAASLPFKLPAK